MKPQPAPYSFPSSRSFPNVSEFAAVPLGPVRVWLADRIRERVVGDDAGILDAGRATAHLLGRRCLGDETLGDRDLLVRPLPPEVRGLAAWQGAATLARGEEAFETAARKGVAKVLVTVE